jgi:hypothetical protein
MTKELLKAKIKDISSMNLAELYEFGASVDASLLEVKYKAYLYRAMEDRTLTLKKYEELGYMMEECEVKPEEFKI